MMNIIQRPWLLQLGPLTIQTDAREELITIRTGMAAGDYIDAIWALRYANCLAEDYCLTGKSAASGWPYRSAAKRAVDEVKTFEANVSVTLLRKKVQQ